MNAILSFLKQFYLPLLFFLLAGAMTACKQEGQAGAKQNPTRKAGTEKKRTLPNQVPDYALEVLSYIRAHNRAPENYAGGRQFENRERRLPRQSANGQPVTYREWDVHPKKPGQNRGPERLVTGSDNSAWFTADHYQTFIKLE